MSTVILDHCTGSNGDPLDGRTPDTTNTPGGTWIDESGLLQILSNKIQCPFSLTGIAHVNAGYFNLTVSAAITGSNHATVGLILRFADTDNYLLAVLINDNAVHQIRLYEVVAGVQTLLTSSNASIVAGSSFTLTFSVDGNDLLTATVGSTTITATDTNGSSNTEVGIYSSGASGSTWDNFTVTIMPTPILTVADRADGTGATATISGGTSGTNTLYVQPFAPESTWAVGGVRTGDGTVALSLQGYFWAYALGAGATISNIVPFAATDSARSVQDRMSDAVVARVQQLVMAQGINVRVYNQIIEDDRIAGFPCIFVVFAGENEDDAGGLNDLDDVGYPFRVLIVDRNSENYQVPKGKYLLWRQQIARALRNQRLTTVAESINTKVRYSNIADKRLPQYQYFVSALKVNCISREVRGLT